MALLNGAFAATFAGIFSGFYAEGSLYRANSFADDGMGGGSGPGFGAGEPVKVQIDAATEAMRGAEGYVDGDVRILMLAHGVASPTTDDELGAGGKRYMIESVATDPCGSYYELRGRRKNGA